MDGGRGVGAILGRTASDRVLEGSIGGGAVVGVGGRTSRGLVK